MQFLPLSESSAQAYVEALRAGLQNDVPTPASADFPVVSEITVGNFENDGQTLADARVRERFGVTVLAVTESDGEIVLNPPAGSSIRSGDRLRLFGLAAQIAEFAKYVRASGEHRREP